MVYGIGPQKGLPKQNWDAVLLHFQRFTRASEALARWSEKAKKAIDYFEDRQWTEEERAEIEAQGRPCLTINKIKPLVNLVYGYHLTNRTDIRFLPGHDGSGSADTARLLSLLAKQVSEINQVPWIDAEVFLAGILSGRGFYDVRLSFENNDFGEVVIRPKDQFAVYVDPDCDTYDINSGRFVMDSRFVSLDEIEVLYGKEAAEAVGPLSNGMTQTQHIAGLYEGQEEASPPRTFGQEEDERFFWRQWGEQFYDWVDRQRKTIRLLDIQHYIWTERLFFHDLYSGDRKPVPDHWTPTRIRKVVDYAVQRGQPITVMRRKVRRLRWTHMVGNVIVYDRWSPYDTFTTVPYFPYFRRGFTQGMVESLIDVQDEINKQRSARLNIIGRTSNGGWIYPEGSLNAQQKANLELFGSAPGVHVEYRIVPGGQEPKPLEPSTPPIAHQQLEQDADSDMKAIAGINESALGQIEKSNVSGRAIEARQRQAVIGLEGFMQNYSRSKELLGRKMLELFQNHYTEERIVQITGEDGSIERAIINREAAGEIANNITVGKYTVAIDESPISKTFLQAQFDELLQMKELGVPIPDDHLVDASSYGRKKELKSGLAQQRMMQEMMAAAGMVDPMAGGGQAPAPGQASPPAGSVEKGAPVPMAAE